MRTIDAYEDAERSTHVVYGNMRYALMYAAEWQDMSSEQQDALKRVLWGVAKIASGHPDSAGAWGDIRTLAQLMLAGSLR